MGRLEGVAAVLMNDRSQAQAWDASLPPRDVADHLDPSTAFSAHDRRSTPPTFRLIAVIIGLSLGAWLASGRAVLVPLVAVGGFSLLAGLIDARTCRIPNRVVAAAMAALVAGACLTAAFDQRAPAEIIGSATVGAVVSGAPFLAALWVLVPAAVGAGDVKLLTVQGATIGLLAPLAAPLVILGGTVGALVTSARLGRRQAVPLGPGLAVGYAGAVAAGLMTNVLLGGPYT